MSFEQKLKELGLALPELPAPGPDDKVLNYQRIGNVLYLSGHGPKRGGTDPLEYVGKLGRDYTTRQGYETARLTTVNCLGTLKQAIGDLDNVRQIVKLLVMVNSTQEFTGQPLVAHGAPDLLVELFGDAGKHARSAVGMGQLPNNMAVEIEMIVEVAE
jgi:enamine deaminase RidA (YjgF/YER057c/UK114 family)